MVVCPVFQGAKNHGVVMPDANKENTLNQVSTAVENGQFLTIIM